MGVEGVAGLLIVLAMVCLGIAAFLFFRESWFMQWLRGMAGFVLVGAALYLVLLSASLFGYQQVSDETPLATISFEQAGAQAWAVTIAEANGDRRVFRLLGDIWQLDVRLLRYTGVASIFGAAPSFQLERLSSNYLSFEDEANKERSDYGLVAKPLFGFDLWQRVWDGGSLLMAASRSSVVLVPIVDGAIFSVLMGESGLDISAANSAADVALKQVGK